MKQKRFLFVLVTALAAILLSGCGSQAAFANSWPGLATDGENAYLASGQHVYAVRLSDGAEIWRYPAKSDNNLQFIAQPVVAPDGSVIVGSAGSDHRLVALDPAQTDPGTNAPVVKWTFTEAKDRWVAGVLIMDDLVYAPNTDGTLYVLELDDGFSTKSSLKKITLNGSLWAQPSTDGNLVYVSSLGHHLSAFDAETFESAWAPVDLSGAAPGSPLVGPDGDIYVGSFSSQVFKVDPSTGRITPFASTEGWVWGGPVSDGVNIYFGDLEGYFYAVDISSGSLVWSIRPDGPIVGQALKLDDFIVFATESGSLYAVDQEGKIVWQREVGGQIYTPPVSNGSHILVAPMKADFQLSARDVNGNQIWQFTPEN